MSLLINLFADTDLLVLFSIVPGYMAVIVISFYYYKRKLTHLFGDKILQRLVVGRSLFRWWLKKILLVMALFLLIIAICNPRWGKIENKKSRNNTDLIILIDVSSSMLVEDVPPSRLEKVKLKVREIINLQKGTQVGITVFAGSSFVYTPLTTDYNSLQTFVKNISTDMVSRQGTDLTLGLQTSLEAFIDNDAQKVLVAFTDGENHNKEYKKVIKNYVDRGITVFMIGVGTPGGERIPVRNENGVITEYLRDSLGNFVISKLDYNSLADITEKTGGVYFPLTAQQDDILAINQYVNQDTIFFEEKTGKKILKSRYQIFAILAFLLLLAEMLIGTRKQEIK